MEQNKVSKAKNKIKKLKKKLIIKCKKQKK